MKKKDVKNDAYQQLLKDIGGILKEGRKKADTIIKGMPTGIKNDILKMDNFLIKKNKRKLRKIRMKAEELAKKD